MARSRSALVAIVLLLMVSTLALGTAARPTGATETPVAGPADWAVGWQVSAPRPGLDVVSAGAPVELGLRQRYAGPDDRVDVVVEMVAPDGASASTTLTLAGDEWAFVLYPDGFAGAGPTQAGGYEVRYLVDGQPVVADTFTVE